ncbi:MAG: ribonuclease HII [Candidatus Omnitrophota bacterium]
MLYHERKALKEGFRRIAGVDEAGRGPLAGPVVAASVILKKTRFEHRIDDSKRLTPKSRELAYHEILEKAWVGVGIVSEEIIDKINIYNATAMAMDIAVEELAIEPEILLIDGRINLRFALEKRLILQGDSKSLSIAAASIVAKVTRDNIMQEYHRRYPLYNFKCHKGYGTREHMRNLENHGPSPIHRQSFKPVKIQLLTRR